MLGAPGKISEKRDSTVQRALDREAGLPSQLGALSMTLNLDKSLHMLTCHTTGAQRWHFPDSLRELRGSRRQSSSHKPVVKCELYDLLRRDLELLNENFTNIYMHKILSLHIFFVLFYNGELKFPCGT